MSPRSSGQASQPYETVSIGTISSPSEGGKKPQGENHQALAVKGETHPTCGLESNPGRSGQRRTCYHGATKFYTKQLKSRGIIEEDNKFTHKQESILVGCLLPAILIGEGGGGLPKETLLDRDFLEGT